MLETEVFTNLRVKLAWGLWDQGHYFCRTSGIIIFIIYCEEQVNNVRELASVSKRLKMKDGM